MNNQKLIKLFKNTQNEECKFSTRNQVEINGESRGLYNASSQIKFKTLVIRSDLCDYSDAYILASGTITVTGAGTDDAAKITDEKK